MRGKDVKVKFTKIFKKVLLKNKTTELTPITSSVRYARVKEAPRATESGTTIVLKTKYLLLKTVTVTATVTATEP